MGMIGAGLQYEDRGDPTAYDFLIADFTTDGNWHDLDLSAIVPKGVKLVHFTVIVGDDSSNKYIYFRKNGNANAYNANQAKTIVANIYTPYDFFCVCDNNRVIEYMASNTTWSSIALIVRGWFH